MLFLNLPKADDRYYVDWTKEDVMMEDKEQMVYTYKIVDIKPEGNFSIM